MPILPEPISSVIKNKKITRANPTAGGILFNKGLEAAAKSMDVPIKLMIPNSILSDGINIAVTRDMTTPARKTVVPRL